MDIKITITDDQTEALKRLSPDVSIEEAAQNAISNVLQSTVESIFQEKATNLIAFLKDNPEVETAIKADNNLDDTFAPVQVVTPPEPTPEPAIQPAV